MEYKNVLRGILVLFFSSVGLVRILSYFLLRRFTNPRCWRQEFTYLRCDLMFKTFYYACSFYNQTVALQRIYFLSSLCVYMFCELWRRELSSLCKNNNKKQPRMTVSGFHLFGCVRWISLLMAVCTVLRTDKVFSILVVWDLHQCTFL